jgi:wobble nucleotide-excising tRNase
MDKEKEEAKTALERHYAARHFEESRIAQKEAEKHLISERLECTEEILSRIESQIQKIEQRIKESSVGATKLNALLRHLLPGNNIEVVTAGDDQFQFHRDSRIATHLSDGEKTAVTFAYFLTSLEAKGARLGDTIVFVDDPVSSLDSNHIYAAYALIVERLESSRQLFVSTHNAEFFNLLKSKWLDESNGGRNKKDTRAYHVWRSLSPNGMPQGELLDLHPLLRQFKSEYEFIFSQLYNFARTKNPSFHEAFTVPNLLRKFLEAYLGFRKPGVRSWSKKLELLLDSPDHRREIQKFADDASHLQALGRSLQHPDFVSNAQRCVQMVLDALERRDRDHYESLCEVIKEASA